MRRFIFAIATILICAGTALAAADETKPAPFDYVITPDAVTLNGVLLQGNTGTPDAWAADGKTFTVLDKEAGYAKDATRVYVKNNVLPGAAPATFTLLATVPNRYYSFDKIGYAKDANTVYLDRYPIPGADPATFTILDATRGYSKDKNSVYWAWVKVKGANPATFTVLGIPKKIFYERQPGFARDGNTIYRGTEILHGVDAATFTPLDQFDLYTKDAKQVFYRNLTLVGADVPTFTVLAGATYAKDKNSVWAGYSRLQVADTATFTELSLPKSELYSPYGKDKAHVYLREDIIAGADPESFEAIDYSKAKDKNTAYYRGKKTTPGAQYFENSLYIRSSDSVAYDRNTMRDADAGTFVLLPGTRDYGKDKNAIFYKASSMPEAKADTFTVLPKTDEKYAKDAERVYFKGRALRQADPKTFTILHIKGDYAKDAKHVYWAERVLEEADPATFTVLGCAPKETTFGSNYNYCYAKDANSIYYGAKELSRVDSKSAVFLGPESSYLKDAKTVYYQGRPLRDADPATFTPVVLSGDYRITEVATDKKGLWIEDRFAGPFTGPVQALPPLFFDSHGWVLGKGMAGFIASRTNFTSAPVNDRLFQPYPLLDIYRGYNAIPAYATDGSIVLFQGSPVDGADPATFRTLPMNTKASERGRWESGEPTALATDKNALYSGAKKLATITGALRIIWEDSSETPAGYVLHDDKQIFFVRMQGQTLVAESMPGLNPESYTVLEALRPGEILGTDGTTLYMNATALPGVTITNKRTIDLSLKREDYRRYSRAEHDNDPATDAMTRAWRMHMDKKRLTEPRSGALRNPEHPWLGESIRCLLTDNAIFVPGYGRLTALNTQTKEVLPVAPKGFVSGNVYTTGYANELLAFDGRFRIQINKYGVYLCQEGESFGKSAWVPSNEASRPAQKNPEGGK